jgi:hypothetical protein
VKDVSVTLASASWKELKQLVVFAHLGVSHRTAPGLPLFMGQMDSKDFIG